MTFTPEEMEAMQTRYTALCKEVDGLKIEISTRVSEMGYLAEKATGLAINNIVRLTRGKNAGKEAIVRSMRNCVSSDGTLGQKPWLMVSLRKADGSFSSQEIHAFGDWEKIEG